MQDDDGAMPRIEMLEGSPEHLAVGDAAREVGRARHVDLIELDLDHPPSTTPGEIEAGIDGQAVEPRVEPVRVAEAREVAPGSDERLLDRIARELRVPEDESGGRVQPRDGQVDERGEGVMIAPPALGRRDLAGPRSASSAARPWWRAH